MRVLALALLPVLVLIALLPQTHAAIRVVSQVYGDVQVMVVYDSDQFGNVMEFAYYPPSFTSLGRMYLLSVSPNYEAVARQIVSRTLDSIQVITEPNGCSGLTQETSVINTNCAVAGIDTLTRREQLKKTWYLPWWGDRSTCLSKGGSMLTCLGKPFVVTDSTTKLRVREDFDEYDLLMARFVFVKSYMGPHGELQSYVEVHVKRPLLVVLAPLCVLFGDSFSGNYILTGTDAYSAFLTYVHTAFQRFEDPPTLLADMRVLLERDNSTVVTQQDRYRIVLASATGTRAELYEEQFVSDWMPVQESISESFVELIKSNTTIPMYGNNTNCSASFGISPQPFELIPPPTTTILDFANQNPVRYYRTRMGNYHIGAIGWDNTLRFAYCPEFTRCGAVSFFESPEFPYPRYDVHPNVNWEPYDLNCIKPYPPAPTFRGFGTTGNNGGTYTREYDAGDLCRFPFLNKAYILSDSNPRARELDCAKQNAVMASNRDYCWRPRVWAPVPKEFLDYFGFGLLKLNPNLNGAMRVPVAQFQQACDSYNPQKFPPGTLFPMQATNEDFLLFLTERFLWWKPFPTSTIPYVVCNPNNVNCIAYYDVQNGIVRAKAWARTDPAWPVCLLPFSKFEAPGRFQSLPTETVNLLKVGQNTGNPHDGKMAKLRSLPGWSFNGVLPTCPIQPDLGIFSNTRNYTDNPFENWFQICLAQDRGTCRDDRPRTCQCNPFYAPSGVFVSGTGEVSQSIQPKCPCCCPATSQTNGFVRINGETFFSTGWLACGGIDRGECSMSVDAQQGQCVCNLGIVTSPYSVQKTEPAWDSVNCACPVPRLSSTSLQNGIQRQACSGRGSCCPITPKHISKTPGAQTGVGAGGVLLNECFLNNVVQTGCNCETSPGWTGDACACVGRFNYAYGKTVLSGPVVPSQAFRANFSFLALGNSPVAIRSISIRPQVRDFFGPKFCTPLRVFLSTSQTSLEKECFLIKNEYDCGELTFASFVMVRTNETVPLCQIFAYNEPQTVTACSGHGNFFAQRFWASETTRGIGVFTEMNLANQRMSAAGCAHRYECMCDPSYLGAGCGAGTSSAEISPEGAMTFYACGSNSLPPTGQFVFNQQTSLGECVCAPYNAVDLFGKFVLPNPVRFVGDACEAAVWNQKVCGGFQHVRPFFPYGTCSFDLWDYERDALWTPLIQKPGSLVNAFRYRMNQRPNATDGSIFAVNGTMWEFPLGAFVDLNNLVGFIGSVCYPRAQTSMNATFLADGLLSFRPLRVNFNATVANVGFTCGFVSAACMVVTYTQQTFSKVPAAWCGDSFSAYASANYSCVVGSSVQWFYTGETFETFGVTQTNVTMVCADLSPLAVDSRRLYESLRYGNLNCNNAMQRFFDANLAISRADYVPRCSAQPITLFNNVIGWAFGLMYDQIPNLIFPDNCVRDCTLEHFKLIASLMNNVTCEGVELNDPGLYAYGQYLANRTFTDYFLKNNTAQALPVIEFIYSNTTVQATVTKYWPVQASVFFSPSFLPFLPFVQINDLVNAPEWTNAFNAETSSEPEMLSYEFVYMIFSVDTVNAGVEYLKAGYTDLSVITNDTVLQAYIHDQKAFVREFYRVTKNRPLRTTPGWWQGVVGFISPSSFSFDVKYDADVIEVYDGLFRPCATFFNARKNQTLRASCDSHLPLVDQYNNNPALLAYINNITANVDTYMSTHSKDFPFVTTNPDLTAGTSLAAYFYNLLMSYPGFMKFRYVGVNAPLLTGNLNPSNDVSYLRNFLAKNPNLKGAMVDFFSTTSDTIGETLQTVIESVTESVVVNHVWPFNAPWANATAGKTCRAINISSLEDQQMLSDFWSSAMAPRRCSRTTQCEDFARIPNEVTPECLFPSWHIPWRQSDPLGPQGASIGDEGGCACPLNGTGGFFNQVLFCQRCVAGWGPESSDEWQAIIRFQQVYAGYVPNNVNFPLGNNTYQVNPPYCLFPFQYGRVCSGGGYVNTTQTKSLQTFVMQRDPHEFRIVYTPACPVLVVGSDVYQIQTPVTNVFATQWLPTNTSSNTTITQINGEMFIVNPTTVESFALGSCVAEFGNNAWTCFIRQETNTLVECKYPGVLSDDYHTDFDGFQLQFKPGVFWATVVTAS